MAVETPEKSTRRNAAGKPATIKEDCVVQAMKVIANKGLEALSLREVARNLGVSHQAPYKHFASRDHLLAEVIRRCLREFATALHASKLAPDGTEYAPEEAMRRLGATYLTYAIENPLAYRLMFATPWPEEANQLGLEVDARAAFDVLADRMSKVKTYLSQDDLNQDALFVWSTIHGVAGVIESEAMVYLNFNEDTAQKAIQHAMFMIDRVVYGEDMASKAHPEIGSIIRRT